MKNNQNPVMMDPNKICLAQKKTQKSVRIFIDVDGVVADWLKAACKLFSIETDVASIRKKLKTGMDLDKTGEISSDELWSKITEEGPEFWANLELFTWSKKLITEMKKLGDICFLTSPSKKNDVASQVCDGKVQWIHENFDDVPWLLGYWKEMVASPNALLIDDSKKKIDKFEKAGGHAYQWPHQYKLFDGDATFDEAIADIKNCIKEMKEG